MSTILYLGQSDLGGTSRHRADALTRLGHQVVLADPYAAAANQLGGLVGKLHFRTGYRFLQKTMKNWIIQTLALNENLDLIWVNSGELFGRQCVAQLRTQGVPVILYNNDDPTGGRDGRRFDSLLQAISLYDHCAVLRETNIIEYQSLGAKSVQRVWMSYDEVAHRPFQNPNDIPECFRSEVAFIGTWMRDERRDQFLLGLIDRGVPVSIWGQRWEKSPLWNRLKIHHRGGNLTGRDYVAAIQGAKINIGLLSKGNRDLHTRRSVEIPYAGGLLCAERTPEHLQLYREDQEAVFWSSAEECAEKCLDLLAHPDKRERIRLAGMRRVIENQVGNEDICQQILEHVMGVSSGRE